MNTEAIIEQIDAEISKLQQAKILLAGVATTPGTRTSGRPRTAKSAVKSIAAILTKRVMSAEGKAKIAAAQKARWAKSKRAAKKAVKTAAPAKSAKSTVPAKP